MEVFIIISITLGNLVLYKRGIWEKWDGVIIFTSIVAVWLFVGPHFALIIFILYQFIPIWLIRAIYKIKKMKDPEEAWIWLEKVLKIISKTTIEESIKKMKA